MLKFFVFTNPEQLLFLFSCFLVINLSFLCGKLLSTFEKLFKDVLNKFWKVVLSFSGKFYDALRYRYNSLLILELSMVYDFKSWFTPSFDSLHDEF